MASSVLADDWGVEKATFTYSGRYQVKNESSLFLLKMRFWWLTLISELSAVEVYADMLEALSSVFRTQCKTHCITEMRAGQSHSQHLGSLCLPAVKDGLANAAYPHASGWIETACEHSSEVSLILIIGFCNRSQFQGRFITETRWEASYMLKTRRVCVEGILYVPVICEWKWGRGSLWAASDFSLETAHAKISYTLREAFALDIGQAVNQEWIAAAERRKLCSCGVFAEHLSLMRPEEIYFNKRFSMCPSC